MMKFSLFLVVSAMAIMPYFLSAAPARAAGCTSVDKDLTTYDAELPNLPKYCSIGVFTQKVLNVAFTLIGGVSLVFLMIGGVRYMTAAGNEERAAAGKKTALYAVVGLVVVIMASAIVNIVVNLVLFGKTI